MKKKEAAKNKKEKRRKKRKFVFSAASLWAGADGRRLSG